MQTNAPANRLTLRNRAENLGMLQEFVRRWGRQRGLSPARLDCLTQAAAQIFQYVLERGQGPDTPGAISFSLEDQDSRLRLVIEDDSAPPHQGEPSGALCSAPEGLLLPHYQGVCPLADSLIYYRTEENRNRFVLVFSP